MIIVLLVLLSVVFVCYWLPLFVIIGNLRFWCVAFKLCFVALICVVCFMLFVFVGIFICCFSVLWLLQLKVVCCMFCVMICWFAFCCYLLRGTVLVHNLQLAIEGGCGACWVAFCV